MPSAANRQGIAHCLESGHRESYRLLFYVQALGVCFLAIFCCLYVASLSSVASVYQHASRFTDYTYIVDYC